MTDHNLHDIKSGVVDGLRDLLVPLDNLNLDPANARLHPERNRRALEASLRRFGQRKPIVVQRDGMIVRAGNGTVAAARALGWSHVAAVVLDDDHTTATAYAIADNRTAELAEWDDGVLAATLAGLEADGFNVDELEWSDKELNALADGLDAEPVREEAEEVTVEARAAVGDVWRLGDQILRVGSCLDVDPLPDVGCLIHDPPWDEEGLSAAILERFPADAVLSFSDGGRLSDVVGLLGAPTWLFTWDCVTSWYVPGQPLRRAKYAAWYGDFGIYDPEGSHYGEPGDPRTVTNTRGTYQHVPDPRGKHLSDVFSCPITNLHGEGDHKHGKPVAWMRMLIANCTRGVVFDPCCGGGSSLIACEQLGRVGVFVEIDPAAADLTLARWETYTGRRPEKMND